MRTQFEPEEWDTIGASVLNQLGLARPAAQDVTGEAFSPNTFLTNWAKISPEAKSALFGGKRYAGMREELDKFVDVLSSLKGAQKFANTSNTARAITPYLIIRSLAGGLAGMAVGTEGVATALGAVVLSASGARSAAALLTNQRFLKWLTTPVANPQGLSAHFGRLSGIAAQEPDLAPAIELFLKSFQLSDQQREQQ